MNTNDTSYPSISQAWVIFAIFLAVNIGIALLMALINETAGINNLSIGNFIGYNVSMLFIIWFAWKNKKTQTDRVFHYNPIPVSLYVLLVIVTLSLSVFLDPMTSLVPLPDWMEEIFKMMSARDIWTFMMVGITGPILEEVLFRGIILDGFLDRYKPFKAIFWSAFLFGLFHLNPWQFIPGFLIGLLLGYIYWKTRSLIPVILVHIANNSFSYFIMYIYGEDVVSFSDLFTEKGDYYLFYTLSSLIFFGSSYLLFKILDKNIYKWTFSSKTNSSS